MTHLLTRVQAADLLAEHGPVLTVCIEQAWTRWLSNPDSTTASRRTRAMTVYDYLTEEVEKRFANVKGVKLARKYGSLNMTVAETAVIKFKKFRSKGLRTSGIDTNARHQFLRQNDVLDGMVVTHLVVGYLLDELELSTDRIAVTCPLGDGNLWALDLERGEGSAGVGGADPIPIDPKDPRTVGTIVRSIEAAANDEKAASEE